MKRIFVICMTMFLVLALFSGIFLPVLSESEVDTTVDSDSTVSSRGSPRWETYKAYYNQTFNIDKTWASENVSAIVFVQSYDKYTKSKDSGGSAGTFDAAEVLQSTFDDLDGKVTKTGTSRRVLGELFTATWCGYCPGAVGAFDRMLRDSTYFPSKVTLVELHPTSSDHGNADSQARLNWYNFGSGVPTAIFDGYSCLTGGNSNANSTNIDTWYRNTVNTRRTTTSPIDITTFGGKTGNSSGWVNISVELMTATPLRNLKVNIFVVEDIYPATKSGAYYRYTGRDILTPLDFIPPNNPPNQKAAINDFSILEDDSDSTSIVLKNAFEDEDLDVLSFSSNKDGSAKENIQVDIDSNGNVTLTPDANWNGEEDITFYADDGIAEPIEQTVSVTVTQVNDPPFLAHSMVDFTMFEDVAVENKYDLNYIFDDIDQDEVLNAVPQDPLEFSYYGSKYINVSIVDGWVSFDPVKNWNGNETITFIAEDFIGSMVSDNVRIWVREGNDPPKLAKEIPKAVLNEDEDLDEFIDLNEYFTDLDGDTLTFSHNTLDNVEIKLSYWEDSVFVSLYPAPDYYGTDTVTFEATDIPGSDPVYGTMEVEVLSVNDRPILNETDEWDIVTSSTSIVSDIISVNQGTPVEIYVTAYDPADYDELTFTDDTDLFDIDPSTGKISFTPTNDDVGEYNVEIVVDDGQAEKNTASAVYRFIVENINDAPDTPQIIKPVESKTYVTGKDIEFEGIADDPDLYLKDSEERLAYEWTTNKSSETLSYTDKFTAQLEPGFYTIKFTVSDKDGLANFAEISIHVDIDREKDTDSDGTPDYQDDDDDGDGIPDTWEKQYSLFLDPLNPSDAKLDSDKDGYTNLEEYLGADGKPEGGDSTDPTRKSSNPGTKKETEPEDEDSTSESTNNSLMLGAGLGVIIVVIILVLLFMFLRSKKKQDKEQDKSVTTEQQVQPQLQPGDMPQGPGQFPPMPMPPMPPMPGMMPMEGSEQQPGQTMYPYPPINQVQDTDNLYGDTTLQTTTPGLNQTATSNANAATGLPASDRPLLGPAVTTEPKTENLIATETSEQSKADTENVEEPEQ